MRMIASPGQLRASFLRWALVFVPLLLLLGMLSSLAGNPASAWFMNLAKPGTYPPPEAFGIVWTILYILMGLAAALVASARGAWGRGRALVLFAVQMVLNLAWSPVFFAMHRISGALYLLFALDIAVLVTVVAFWKVRSRAGMLLLPYVAWIGFATLLNWQMLDLNRDADGQAEANAVIHVQLAP